MSNREIQAVGLDIGTSAVRCVVGELAEDGNGMHVVGFGRAESRGLRSGIVNKTDQVVESVRRAVEEAERVSGREIHSVTVNLSGEYLRGENKTGVVAVAGAGREISEEDVERAVESASAMSLPAGWEIVDRLPQEFIIDGQDGISEPIGMKGARLESRVHVVTSPSAARQNIVKAVYKADLEIAGTVIEPLAAAEASLSDDDKEYGCALINMGSELTSLMIFHRGAVQHTTVFPFGGMHFTKDIAVGLRVSIQDAAAIKHRYGCVSSNLLSDFERQEVIEITPVGRAETRGLTKEILCDIMQPRAQELLEHVAAEVARTGAQISSGVVLTGGGVMSRGMVEMAEHVFDAPSRLGFADAEELGGLADGIESPDWAVACGLALMSFRAQMGGMGSEGRSARERFTDFIDNLKEKFR
jgi:cell division protein FtsA